MSVDLNSFLEQQMFREENCVSMYTRFAGISSDQELRSMFHDFGRQAQAHRDILREILVKQGIHEDGVMQNRATQEAAPAGLGGARPDEGAALSQQSIEAGIPQTGLPPTRGRDEDMIADSLLSMRAMSESYRSALRVTSDENIAATLIGMRQEEDRQKERLARYLHGRS